tara:strand:+ start:3145 stop:3780 length:636 start_codon:yes stop_codon:yes gene_type:complete
MGRYERASKSSLKLSHSLVSGLIDNIRRDLRRQEAHIDGEMRERVEAIQKTLIEVASIQDAIIAGSLEVKKGLSRAQKKLNKGGSHSDMKTEILESAKRLGELRKLHNDAVARIQGALARPPSAVEIIERMMKDIFKMAGSWESGAREIDETISDAVDANQPVEMIELERDLTNNGYDVILAGDLRSEQNIEASRNLIQEMSRDQGKAEDQ